MKLQVATADGAHAIERQRAAVAEVVDHHDLVPVGKQFHAGMRADIASATRDQDPHGFQCSAWRNPARPPARRICQN